MASSSAAPATAASGRQAGEEEEKAEDRALTGLLSDDTLLHVIRGLSTRELLSSVAFVCHRWRRLCASSAVPLSLYSLVRFPFGCRAFCVLHYTSAVM